MMLNKAPSASIEGETYLHRIPLCMRLRGCSHAKDSRLYNQCIDHMVIITLIFLDFLMAFCAFWFYLRWGSLIGNAHRICTLAIEVVFLFPLLL